jgi:Tfp pilus assembly protein PilO
MPLSGENTMNFSKLPKDRRNKLILVVLITLATLGALGFGLIKYQYSALRRLAEKKVMVDLKFRQMQEAIKHADGLESDLAEARKKLAAVESDVASGDLYAWIINTLRRFKTPYKVELPQFSPIGTPTPVDLLPNFPYQQAALTVAGTAHFHDFGRFLADFENQFPHIRVLNLSLDLNASATFEESEMLSFRMEIVTLVKANPS